MLKALLFPVLALFPAAAIAQAEQPATADRTIVVTGQRILDYRDRLAACLARRCPPNEDIDATLALT